MVYLGTSIMAGNRGGNVDLENNSDRNGGSNGHSSDMHNNRSSTENRDHGNESSGDEDREGQIHVGKDYQISPSDWIPPERKLHICEVFYN